VIKFNDVQLNISLPSDSVGMVFMQPFTRLSNPIPRWEGESIKEQMSSLVRCLNIAGKCDHGCNPTHFTIFPEYSIPGLAGIELVSNIIADSSWKPGTVVMGGVDALSKEDYTKLCANGYNVDPSIAANTVRTDQWVNCFVTWAKSQEGVVQKWIQCKLCPASNEENNPIAEMYKGSCVNLYSAKDSNGRTFKFLALVCFDWVGTTGAGNGISGILKELSKFYEFRPDGKNIDLVFILEHNPEPSHQLFLGGAFDFFNDNHPFLIRDKSILAFVNTAGNPNPGPSNNYGHSCLVFSPESAFSTDGPSPQSYAVKTGGLRTRDALQTCKDALFRERGACVHSLRLYLPSFIKKTAANKRRILDPVLVHGVDNNGVDPRAQGFPVPAVIKWTNDNLDQITHYPAGNLQIRQTLNQSKDIVVKELRWCNAERMDKIIKIAVCGMRPVEAGQVDSWNTKQRIALENMLLTLAMVNCNKSIIMKNSLLQGHFVCDNTVTDVIVVSGEEHEENIKHAMDMCAGKRARRLLLVSCDQLHSGLLDKDKNVWDTETTIRRCSLHQFQDCLSAATLHEFQKKLEALGV
jgi:hypothetical protein